MHTEDGHTLMQRDSDIEFLRRLARRTGRWCRITCDGQPGVRTGYFAAPSLDGNPRLTLDLTAPTSGQVDELEFEWDVCARRTSQPPGEPDRLRQPRRRRGNSGLGPADLSTRGRCRRSPGGNGGLLTPRPTPTSSRERARAVLRDAGGSPAARAAPTVDLLGHVIRVGSIVAVQNVGNLLSGKYLVGA